MSARVLIALPLLLVLALCAACRDEDARTQVMLEIDADPAVRVRLQTLRVLIDVSDDEGESWQKRISNTYRPADIGGDWREFEWPARLGLVPAEGNAERQFAVRVQALDRKGELYVWQQAVAQFAPGRTTLLAVALVDRCTVAALECGDEDCVGTDGCETCRAGNCVDVELLDELPEFDPDSSGSLFDGSLPIGEDSGPPDAGRDAAEPEPDAGDPPDDAGNTSGPVDSGPAMDSGPSDAGPDAAPDADTGPPDPPPFTVTGSTPAVAAPMLSDVRGVLSVTFSAAVDPTTVTASSVTVQHEGRAITGALATSMRTTTFTPDRPWVLSGAYTLSATAAIKSQDGTPLTPFTLGFENPRRRVVAHTGVRRPRRPRARARARRPRRARVGARHGHLHADPRQPVRSARDLVAAGNADHVGNERECGRDQRPPPRGRGVAREHRRADRQRLDGWTALDAERDLARRHDPDVFLSESDELYLVAADTMNTEALDGYQFTLGAASPAEIPLALATQYNRRSQVRVLAGASLVVWQHSNPGAGLGRIKAGTLSSADGADLSTAGVLASAPSLAVNAAQNAAAVVWLEAHQTTPGNTRVWASRVSAGGSWSERRALSGGTAPAQSPKVAIDDRGRAVATWTESGTILGATFDPTAGSWSAPVPVSTVGALDDETSSVVLAPDGNGLAVWAQNSVGMSLNEIWASRYLAGRGFQTATRARISDLEAGTGSVISLAIDDAGRALAGWYQTNKIWVARFE